MPLYMPNCVRCDVFCAYLAIIYTSIADAIGMSTCTVHARQELSLVLVMRFLGLCRAGVLYHRK